MESVMLLFDAGHPCWTMELAAMAGEDPASLEIMAGKGLLDSAADIYWLRPEGKDAYRKAARECFYNIPPGRKPFNPAQAVSRTLLELLLDRAIWGRWGIKEFRTGERLPYIQSRSGENLFDRTKDRLQWTYLNLPRIREFLELYPAPTGPGTTPPDLEEFRSWARQRQMPSGDLELDLLFLHHYDSLHFNDLPRQPNDRLRLFHSDRFYFRLLPSETPDLETLCDDLGRFHLFLLTQRRVFLPWYFDRDTTGYDAVNWWFWVTETEDHLGKLKAVLEPLSDSLVKPAHPLRLFGISMEALRRVEGKREYHWDLFDEIAVPLSREI